MSKKTEYDDALHRFRCSRNPELEGTYRMLVKILDEHMKRHTAEMYSPANFDLKEKKGRHNKDLARESMELVKAYKVVQEVWTRIQKQAIAEASLMSFDERVGFFCDWLLDDREVGRLNRRKGVKMLLSAIHEAEQRDNALKEASRAEYRDEPDLDDDFKFTPAEKAADAKDDERAPETWEGDDGIERIEMGEDWVDE